MSQYKTVSEIYSDLAREHGGVGGLVDCGYDELVELTVYVDPNSNFGCSEVKVSLAEAMEKYPDHFAIQSSL